MNIQVFDLDGTLADLTHRLHFVKKDKPEWDKFFEACDIDDPIWWVIELTHKFDNVLILSGRSDLALKKTQDWLRRYSINYKWLKMRKNGDYRPDDIIKLEMLNEFIKQMNCEVEVDFIVDDRQRVVNMWRSNGFNVLQCNAWKENDDGA